MEKPETVEMTITFTKHSDGRVTEVRKIAGKTIYSGPSPCVFIDLPRRWPWKGEDEYEQVTGG